MLFPSDGTDHRPHLMPDELDSYMYQTVGHSGLRVLAQALDLPFFVRTINGTAVNQRGEYGSRKGKAKEVDTTTERGDETEDLYELLKSVKVRGSSSPQGGRTPTKGQGAGSRAPPEVGRLGTSRWIMQPFGGGRLQPETDLMLPDSSLQDAMPEVQGVSVGAILSNYQRVRVEHVCVIRHSTFANATLGKLTEANYPLFADARDSV